MGEDRHLLTGLLLVPRSQRGVADRISHPAKKVLVLQPQFGIQGRSRGESSGFSCCCIGLFRGEVAGALGLSERGWAG